MAVSFIALVTVKGVAVSREGKRSFVLLPFRPTFLAFSPWDRGRPETESVNPHMDLILLRKEWTNNVAKKEEKRIAQRRDSMECNTLDPK